MKTSIALIFAALLATPASAEAPLGPTSFAHQAGIKLSGVGPYHQVALPLAVYAGASRADLGDLRVFNGQGEVLSYALLRREAQAETTRSEVAVPFFPLLVPGPAATGEGEVAVTVRQGTDGTLVSVQRPAAGAKSGTLVRGVVIDASQLSGSIRSLRLLTAPSAVPLHRYAIESSPDLQRWRPLKRDAQLVHLEHRGHRVDSDTVEWDSPADRYLRLLWADPGQAPEVSAVRLGVVETSFRQPQRIWSADIAPASVQGGVYDYAWVGQLPLDKLRINLPQINTLAPLAIQRQTTRFSRHRQRAEAHWETLTRTVAYRLQSPQGELRSDDIALHAGVENRLRLTVDAQGGAIGSEPPKLQIGFVPHVLVFLARGEGPFVLAWGASAVERADLPAATLMPGYDGRGQLSAAPASLAPLDTLAGPAAAPAGKATAGDGSLPARWILWAVLGVGLLVLGAMARALTRQLRQDAAGKP